MILDVGCGDKPRGHVNIDLFHGFTPHQRDDIEASDIENFVISEACNLPFRAQVFDLVIGSHIIEHLLEPFKALNEFKRVARYRVVLNVPNNPVLDEHERHLYSWSVESFRNFLESVFSSVTVRVQPNLSNIRRFQKRKLYRITEKILGRHLAFRLWGFRYLEIMAECKI